MWRYCHVCKQIDQMHRDGPKGVVKSPDGTFPGFFVQIVPREEAEDAG